MEQLLAWLYPNRGPVALLAAAAVVVLLIVAWRRGWHHAARRHPRATVAGVVAAFAVALPVGWYLGSPLFIRTALAEPAPVPELRSTPGPTPSAAGPASPTPSGEFPPVTPSGESPVPPSRSAAPASPSVLEGRFVGADDFHFAHGKARLLETAPGTWTLRIEDFSVRNGPDLYVYLSPDPDGYADGATELGTLKATDGSFNYKLPRGTDVDGVRSVVIWCKAFSVQFGVARLSG